MSFSGGYEGDLDLNNVRLVGDFPIEHSLGGHGIANSAQVNTYEVSLHPSISTYRTGLPLHLIFSATNTASASLNVDGKGARTLKKIVGDTLVNLAANDLVVGKIYSTVYDGQFFQIANMEAVPSPAVSPASQTQAGVAEIATQQETNTGTDDERFVTPLKLITLLTNLVQVSSELTTGLIGIASQAEVNAGSNNTKAVTPEKLAQYVSDKIVGLWKDKGLLNCSLNPNYPAGLKGDAYTVSVGGKIGGGSGKEVQLRDVLYCTADNAGGDEAGVGTSWNVIQANLVQATEVLAGFARIATQTEVNTGTDNSAMITPLKLKTLLDNRAATELLTGLLSIATQAEVNAGMIDTKALSPLKLITYLNTILQPATESVSGLIKVASTVEVTAGIDNSKAVSPQKLAQYVADKVTGLWKDKGVIDCLLNPDYPAGQKGDAYTVSVAGKIGSFFGKAVELRDVIYCTANNAGGNEASVGTSWNVIQANLVQATEVLAGYARIATQTEVNTGTDDTIIVSPLKLKTFLDNRLATELLTGLLSIATQAEVNAGSIDTKAITPLKLITYLNSILQSATESVSGLIKIASTAEVTAGTDNSKAVSPQKLAQYVGDKITGLWKDKGIIDCSVNPNYPQGAKGDAYTVSVAGKIGGVVGKVVELRDVIYCTADNAGGNEASVGSSWNVIQANLVQATEALAGYARIATQTEANTGTDNATIITPLKLKTLLDNRIATELLTGLLSIATQAEVTAGVLDTKAITPQKLITYLNSILVPATESVSGMLRIASTSEVTAGTDNSKAVTPLKLAQYVADKITGLWKDKGIIDCSANPNYPSGTKGDAYTVSVAGKIGGASGKIVELRDVLYCTTDNAGGNEATVGTSWNVIQANLVQATETLAGYAAIATQAEITTGTNDSKFVTPLKLMTILNTKLKPMRTQLRFYSDSLAEAEVLGSGSTDYHLASIVVSGIPVGSTIRQATLVWEGNLRNSNVLQNYISAGTFALNKDGGAFTNFLSVANKLHLDNDQITFHRFVEDNVLSIVTGNGTYAPKFTAARSAFSSVFISGHWVLEIDYENP